MLFLPVWGRWPAQTHRSPEPAASCVPEWLLVLLMVCPEQLPQPGQELAGILEHMTSVEHHLTYFMSSQFYETERIPDLSSGVEGSGGLSSPDQYRAQLVPCFFQHSP